MQIRQRNIFMTIRSEGSILPADLLQRVESGDQDLGGLAPKDYHLTGNEKLNEAISRSWNRLLGAWESFKGSLEKVPAKDPNTSATRERWLLPLFQELGYGRLLATKAVEIEGKSYPISHQWQNTSIHLVGSGVDLDTRSAGVAGAARISPHSLVQEFLNRSDNHLWGFVSNGLQLRILRDNVSLTRQAYVEFDLEAMMNGEVYSDFALLWLLCHQSRVEADRPEDCWLEKWSRTAQQQGTRALDQLRSGVEEAIKALGRGFLVHSDNKPLLEKLRSGALDKQDYYRQLLRLVYRLLFLFVAEDRDLLLAPGADVVVRDRYIQFFSLGRLRRLSERRVGTRHADLYCALRLTMQKLGDSGCAELGLPALGSFLFSKRALIDIEECSLANNSLLEAIRALAFIIDKHGRRQVDYKNLRSEELGSIYEALLELHPVLHAEAATFDLETASGNERKTTGSYYTPESLVQCLLDSALDPVVDEAARKENPGAAILNLKVCDPACGSGHFLIAAAHRIAKRLAAIRTGDEEPAPEAVRSALRDVIGHCIYGVDMNPMAVELCKVSLWMEALEPGKPLSFLDHHIQVGNSLLGTTPALLREGIPDEVFKPIEGDDKTICTKYKKLNKEERKGIRRLFKEDAQPWERLGDLATELVRLDVLSDSDIESVRKKEQWYEDFVRSGNYLFTRLWADSLCAAFVWKKTEELPYPITEDEFRKIEKNPHSVQRWMRDEIQRLAAQYQFFHWHLAFPEVFRVPKRGEIAENEQAGWNGGFDAVLGNPPWEHTELKEKEWFAFRRPDIANAITGDLRKRMIDELAEEDPRLHQEFLNARRSHDGISHIVRSSGRYPLCGRGRINTYAIFAETNRMIISETGRVGCIVPSGIATDDTTKYFFGDLMDSRTLASLYDFENADGAFPGVHREQKFCLLVLVGRERPSSVGADFLFFARNVDDLHESDRHFVLSIEDLILLNPNTRTCPTFRSKRDAEITKAIYRRVSVFVNEGNIEGNPWEITFKQGLFNMTSDSHLFQLYKQLETDGWIYLNNIFLKGDQHYLPLYEGKLSQIFNHRFCTFNNTSDDDIEKGNPRESTLNELMSDQFLSTPRYWVPEESVYEACGQPLKFLLSFHRVANPNNERSSVYTILPAVGASDSLFLLTDLSAVNALLLCSIGNSFIYDYIVRLKVGSRNFSFFIAKQIAVPRPTVINDALKKLICSAALELTYTSKDLKGFAADCCYDAEPFCWDEWRRFLLRAELDAAFFHIYGIGRDDVDHIMDTFSTVKRNDEVAHGEYRTKRVILEIYDEMQRAIETGEPYQTRLDPPPALGWIPKAEPVKAEIAPDQTSAISENPQKEPEQFQLKSEVWITQPKLDFDGSK